MSFDNIDHIEPEVPSVKAGLYLATVVSVLDKTFMGMLSVKLERAVGNSPVSGQIFFTPDDTSPMTKRIYVASK